MPKIERIVGPNDMGKRLDSVARKAFDSVALSQIFKAIRAGKLRLNGLKTKGDVRLKEGDILSYYGVAPENSLATEVTNNNTLTYPMPPIIYENSDIAVINKPIGLKSHDGDDSVATLMARHFNSQISLSFKPAPLHRLDRNSSGLLAIGKTITGARLFSEHSKQKWLEKSYLAIIQGTLKQSTSWCYTLSYANGISKMDAKGHYAETLVTPLTNHNNLTLIKCQLVTGRSHQIRVSASLAGYPLWGDTKYGGHRAKHYYLHAYKLCDISSSPLFPPLLCLPSFIKQFFTNFNDTECL